MPYPSKTSRDAILQAAVRQVEQEGIAGLSLRSLAQSLAIAPNALYRYFPDRAHLEAAIAEEGIRRLHAALARAASSRAAFRGDAEQAVRCMAKVYVEFARKNRALYHVLMTPQLPGEQPSAHGAMWMFTVELLGRLAGPQQAPAAAVALWAFLHGIVVLEEGGVFGKQKPRAAFPFGLDAFLAGLPRPAA